MVFERAAMHDSREVLSLRQGTPARGLYAHDVSEGSGIGKACVLHRQHHHHRRRLRWACKLAINIIIIVIVIVVVIIVVVII